MKNIKFVVLSLLALVLIFSCTDDESRIPDTGDLEMGIVVPGNESVTLCLNIKDNSDAAKAEVTWGEGETETTSFDITGKQIQRKIAVPEGSYIFRVSVYDASDKKVIDFPMAGKSYGANYIGTLKNRAPVSFALNDAGNVDIEWASNPAGCLKTVVSYIRAGETVPMRVEVASDANTSTLEAPAIDANGKYEFNVSSIYYPDMKLYNPSVRPASVPGDIVYDEFPAQATTYSNSGPIEVTSKYLKNAGPNIEASERGGDNNKWGLPKDWLYTSNILNQAGNTYGGWKWENDEVQGVIHFESKDWDGPGFENGKVWQTVKLPAGSYNFTAGYRAGDGNAGMEMYVMAAKGSELPDIENRANALAFNDIPAGTGGEYTVTFTLFEETDVALGLVVTVGGSNHWQQFSHFKIDEVPSTDVTSAYIKNAGPQLEAGHKVGGKWGTPKDWSFTPNILNQEDNTVGGWSTDGGGVIHFETDHWSGPGFNNGKVWQTISLPAGTYAFVTQYGAAGNDYTRMNLNMVVAASGELPNIEDFATGAIAYRHLNADVDRGGKDHAVVFTLDSPQNVSVGLVVTIAGSGDTYIQFNYFKLLNLQM